MHRQGVPGIEDSAPQAVGGSGGGSADLGDAAGMAGSAPRGPWERRPASPPPRLPARPPRPAAQQPDCACALGGRCRGRRSQPPAVSRDGMKTAQDAKGARGERPQRIGLCLVCGLPAAGKSTLARGLRHRLRQEQGWAVGVVAYDDVMPDAFLEEASARPLVRTEWAGPGPRRLRGGGRRGRAGRGEPRRAWGL